MKKIKKCIDRYFYRWLWPDGTYSYSREYKTVRACKEDHKGCKGQVVQVLQRESWIEKYD